MARVSVALTVRNESRSLRECLETLRWADEIVVVDSGSDDGTTSIAREYTGKVYVESDWQGYGVQRQRAQTYTSGDWILMVDADERVTPELRAEIEAVVKNHERKTAYAVPRLSFCFGRFIRHGGWYPDYVVRLYPRESGAGPRAQKRYSSCPASSFGVSAATCFTIPTTTWTTIWSSRQLTRQPGRHQVRHRFAARRWVKASF